MPNEFRVIGNKIHFLKSCFMKLFRVLNVVYWPLNIVFKMALVPSSSHRRGN